MNNTTHSKYLESLVDGFTKDKIQPKVRHYYNFSCPVYVLNHCLKSSQVMPKWQTSSHVGINLESSPPQASLISLVINIKTTLISLQYSIQLNDLFKTVNTKSTSLLKGEVPVHFKKSSLSLTQQIPRKKEEKEGQGKDQQYDWQTKQYCIGALTI